MGEIHAMLINILTTIKIIKILISLIIIMIILW